MRGGAQSHLLETHGGEFYVVKFQNNPQHRRILVNEWVSSVLLDYLQISVPSTALIHITEEFLRENPEVSLSLGTRSIAVQPGWHFGSRFPGDPARIAVYDFLPDALLSQVNNLFEFAAILVFDKWAGNADGRQCVFFRARVQDWSATGTGPSKVGFLAWMIDHGYIFNGPGWDYINSPVQGLYPRKTVYAQIRSLDDFQPWLDRVVHFPEEVIDRAYKQIPPEWIDGEEEEFERVLEKLMDRRKRVPDLIAETRHLKTNPFPNWR